MTNEPSTEVDFLACTLPSPGLAARIGEVQALFDQAESIQARNDGVLFTFQNTEIIAHALMDFIRFEQQCCKTITYELRAEPPHTELALQLRAPADLVSSVQGFYMKTRPSSETQQRILATGDVFRRIGILKSLGEMTGPLGAILCAVVCLGLPVVSGVLGVAGINFLMDDRLLIPYEILCCGAFLWSFERGRQKHGNFIALLLAFVAAGMLIGSMLLSGTRSKAAVLIGCIVLIVAATLNQVFLKGCSCTTYHHE